MRNLSCCERKCNVGYYIITISLISILLLWNIGLTIAITVINNNSDSDNSECYCVEQIRNVIEQIVRLYPDSQLFITLDGGDAVVGTPGEIRLGPNGKSGIFEVETIEEDITQIVSICSIDAITINNATYNEQITYLPELSPAPTDCKADCDNAIRAELPVGTQNANIITNTQTQSIGNVILNVPGMIVLENPENNSIIFISTCRIDTVILED